MQQITGVKSDQAVLSAGTSELISPSSLASGLLLHVTVYVVDTAEPSKILRRRRPRQVTTLTASLSLKTGVFESGREQ